MLIGEMSLKIARVISILSALIIFCSGSVLAEEPVQAVNVTKQAKFSVNTENIPALGDENLSTRYKLSEEQTVTITSTESFSRLYMLFNRPPQSYTLQYGTTITQAGQYGFMYELVTLSSPQLQVSLTLPQGVELCDIVLYGEGELPKSVQQWQPPLEDADMLLLPTHSDDEHIFFGGIMPYYAGEKKMNVQVAYLNNHYGEWYRPHELLAGLWESGITAYPIIPDEFNDLYSESLEHAKTLYDNEKLLGYQVELLRRFKPEVVIGHDLNGEYGHGVHMLNANLLTKAVTISADPNEYKDSADKYGTFDVPKTYIHLYSENSLEFNIDVPLASFDGQTAFEVSVKSFDHHKSQLKYFKVNKGGKYDCRKFGLYRSTVGLDTAGGDFFENITVWSQDIVKPVSSEAISSAPITSSEVVSSEPKTESKPETSSTIAEQPTTLSIFRGVVPFALVAAGILVIILTMIAQNNKNKVRIRQQMDAYKRLSGKDKEED